MKQFRILFYLILTSSYCLSSFACSVSGSSESFLPENKLFIPLGLKNKSGISKEAFDKILDQLEIEFKQEVSQPYPFFKIERKWEDGTVDARASGNGTLIFFGGLARHPLMSPDSFVVVACHEMGHLIGGFPTKVNLYKTQTSPEGQADYFAVLKCARRLFAKDNQKRIEPKIPAYLEKLCLEGHPNSKDYNICVRIISASLNVANVLASVAPNNGPVDLNFKPLPAAKNTLFTYPTNQCRLETFIAAAICPRSVVEKILTDDELSGVCHEANGDSIGMRPSCWFKPSVF